MGQRGAKSSRVCIFMVCVAMSTVALSIGDPELQVRVASALGEAGVRVAGNATESGALARLVRESSADAVLADSAAPLGMAGAGRVPVIVLTEGEDSAFDALAAGAFAVLPPGVDGAALGGVVAALRAGLAVVTVDLLRRVLEVGDTPRSESAAAARGGEPVLTPRELEVLAALADGASNKAIARRLGISFHTVKFHVAGILAKLGAETRTEAVAQGARLGLVML